MDPADLRADIPALDRTVYLNTGASGPSPRRVVEAATDRLAYHEYESPAEEGMYATAFDTYEATRETVADLLGATPDEVALTQSTTDGINRVACALDFEPGDVVVRTDLEHPAGILPWDRLEHTAGVEVRVVETEAGRLDMDAYADAVADAKLVCLSSLTWTHGTRLPVAEVVEVAHDAGALVLADAVQSVGQVPVDVREWGVDFAAAAGHKWLLGPWGAGFLYARADAAEELSPGLVGYRSMAEPGAAVPEYAAAARRFEVGTTSPATYAGLGEAIDVHREVGIGTIRERVERLTDRLKEGLVDELGPEALLSPREYESGLVTFRVTGTDPEQFVERAAEAGVTVRPLPYPEGTVRASVHAFNTAEDIDALLEVV